ncbi:hypothetical protein NEOLEDRAFT_1167578 [Neolentinus lepideus HHB14362 ss-1]|uniref:Uncharacterized protein n=1 Tax=Neolentinus lepideus HHB14362 ss-1 TaxID=1314782 RepID=A0A165UJG2_9AGAM|nr:hypothetical protein NEOLEDRAFT_1167578 [Neolentinus lepideus HHB14362 ss-1]
MFVCATLIHRELLLSNPRSNPHGSLQLVLSESWRKPSFAICGSRGRETEPLLAMWERRFPNQGSTEWQAAGSSAAVPGTTVTLNLSRNFQRSAPPHFLTSNKGYITCNLSVRCIKHLPLSKKAIRVASTNDRLRHRRREGLGAGLLVDTLTYLKKSYTGFANFVILLLTLHIAATFDTGTISAHNGPSSVREWYVLSESSRVQFDILPPNGIAESPFSHTNVPDTTGESIAKPTDQLVSRRSTTHPRGTRASNETVPGLTTDLNFVDCHATELAAHTNNPPHWVN